VDPDEDADVRRREFLSTTAAGAIALMIDGKPAGASAEGLAIWRADLDELRTRCRTVSRSAIAVPVTRLADGLVRTLRGTPERARLYRPLAELTAEAAMLAGWALFDENDFVAAGRWSRVAAHVSKQAQSPDLVAMSLEDWAWAMEALDRKDDALGLLGRMPVTVVTPATRATVEIGRALLLARSGRATPALATLDLVEQHAERGTAPLRLPVDAKRVQEVRGYTIVELGFAAAAYQQLMVVRRMPHQWINHGLIEMNLATAAAQMGEVEQACDHLAQAHAVFTEARSAHQVEKVARFRTTKLDRYADTRAVRELDDYLRTAAEGGGQRYVIARSRRGKNGLHRADCPYMLRGRPSVRRTTWTGGAGRAPAEIAGDEAVRAAYDVCKVCMR
jgi:hypothetical protein